MQQYGYEDGGAIPYPLAAWVWGHRFRMGQHWIEYLLEFLNVLAGFDYQLGEGITVGAQAPSAQQTYRLFTRLGLRRFVFYDSHEKTRHPLDSEAIRLLYEALQEQGDNVSAHGQSPLEVAKALLRSFAAIEDKRSWYAKALFPAHHNLLFWEALRKGATKQAPRALQEDVTPYEIDQGISYHDRNYFARGGEIYYLILSAGTEHDPSLRRCIAARLRRLLTSHNQALGKLAETIDQAWSSLREEAEANAEQETGTLGWIPTPGCALYAQIAQDVATFLEADLDPLEALDLLAHLQGFHLTLYLYHRAHPDAVPNHLQDGSCLSAYRPALLVDALEGGDGGVVRRVSAALFRAQEALIVEQGKQYVRAIVQAWGKALPDHENRTVQDGLFTKARHHFSLGRQRKLETLDAQENRLLEEYQADKITLEEMIDSYSRFLTDLLMDDFQKNFLGVHRKLAKSVGFVAPQKGPSARFVLGDNLLKALVLAVIQPGSTLTYDRFLQELFIKYGLVIGPQEAKQSGLAAQQRINTEYYERNREAFLQKLKYAGLAEEYSDATALVSGAATRLPQDEEGSHARGT